MKISIPARLGFLASGRGSNMQVIINACNKGLMQAVPAVVISNNEGSGALVQAREQKIPAFHLSLSIHPDPELLDQSITKVLKEHNVDFVILAGYMKKIGPCTLKNFQYRIFNIHPALLPRFGGNGMYGMKVHEAVINSGAKESGATVHLVNEEYDQGMILAQKKINVRINDTPNSLAARILELEHALYIDTLIKVLSGEIVLPGD